MGIASPIFSWHLLHKIANILSNNLISSSPRQLGEKDSWLIPTNVGTKQLEAKKYCKNPSCKHSTFWVTMGIPPDSTWGVGRQNQGTKNSLKKDGWLHVIHKNLEPIFGWIWWLWLLLHTPFERVDHETLTWWIWKSFTFSSSFRTQSFSDWPDWWIMDLSFGSLKSWVVPPPSNSGRWRFSSGSPAGSGPDVEWSLWGLASWTGGCHPT